MEKTWLLSGKYHANIIMGIRAETLEEAIEKADEGRFLYIEHLPDGYLGFDFDPRLDTFEVIEE